MAKKIKGDFETDLTRLREIVDTLEAGLATLEETLAFFEEGVALAKKLEERLADAETRIAKLTRDARGTLTLEDAETDA